MTEQIDAPQTSKIMRAALWVAIGALIAAAIVCVIWVLIGDANGIVGKAFLTIILLAGFAGVAIGEANMAPRRPEWLTLASMITWVAILLIGAVMIWMPEPTDYSYGFGGDRFFRFVLIALILQGALLHVRLYLKAYQRYETTFTSIVTYVTIGLVVILSVMLVLPLLLWADVEFRPLYWRVVVALAILAAVGTALVPLVNALFAPKKPRRAASVAYTSPAVPAQWPTYADGITPLPVLPDGATPDWNAYYTGQPTYAAPEQAGDGPRPGYEGFPPPPPLPPQQG
ncbi:hypothetical protein [Microbacterium sp.]|uniref:hypothetical protein n=1 Tax=Microbacterium sp. TaxID=51671 RepID=UPI0025E64EC1|nr:hypothetical protein [Microbacterium sp.]